MVKWYLLLLCALPVQASWLSEQRQALAREAVRLDMLAEQPWPVLPANTLRRGDQGPVVLALAQLLIRTGDLQGPAGNLFDARLQRAVRVFQRRHGLQADGVVGADTHAALAVPPAQRLLQVQQTLSRMAQFHPAAEQLVVNIPAFTLLWLSDDRVRLRSRVVVGKPSRPTPQLHSAITAVELNPFWNVPYSIFRKDYLPRLRWLGPTYLQQHQLEIVVGYGAATEIIPTPAELPKPWPADWRLRQQSGAANALGQIKFVMPNRQAIFLHDTNQPQLFSQPVRAYSSGCVRVELALELASALLGGRGDWQLALFEGRQLRLELDTPLPIALVYWTAWVDERGQLQLRDDLYNVTNSSSNSLEVVKN